ncbi:2OG-Fe(II) oxygenase [Halioxenophilus sp. WMMB6]|uniref:2OG-Fe(II) oxygenase n=1 Tax=Halioxenophilus sp. WMMB6 TaxID=3073815 RepID=UPI00295E9DFF|nr:2OG-Fe(II) oxygenase [Halioxenophilus sp. WMMB6]
MIDQKAFYVVAREPGAEHPALPTWANVGLNPIGLELGPYSRAVTKLSVEGVPGCYQLLDVLAPGECQGFIQLSERLGYLPDAAVSLPREIRHNDNLVWIVDAATDEIIWRRAVVAVMADLMPFDGKRPLGINARFRFYRYRPGDYFKPHTDGSWPGSRVIDRRLITNAYTDRYSLMTFLILLNDDFEGGATRFFVPNRVEEERRVVDVRTPAGGVLCFPHGLHPWHCTHSSEPIVNGTKYIIRTDVLFEL